jgi:hypothetical protein
VCEEGTTHIKEKNRVFQGPLLADELLTSRQATNFRQLIAIEN